MLPWFLRRWLGLLPPQEDSAPVEPSTFRRPPNVAFDQLMADAVRRSLHDDAPFRIYGEWLALQNDPRGPLILSMLEGNPVDLEGYDYELLGPVERQVGVQVTWRWGFWDTLVLADPWGDWSVDFLRAALEHPSALILRELSLSSGRMEPLIDLLADGPLLKLKVLRVNAEGTSLGAWAAVWARIQDLEELVLEGSNLQLGALSLPNLQRLEVRGPLSDSNLADLERANLPVLQTLRVSRPELLVATFGDRVAST